MGLDKGFVGKAQRPSWGPSTLLSAAHLRGYLAALCAVGVEHAELEGEFACIHLLHAEGL